MTESDRDRWNNNWERYQIDATCDSSLLELVSQWAPASGRALEIAGGGSGDAVRLAELGLDVTVVDLSDTGLKLTRELAEAAGVAVATIQSDIESEPLPAGPWDLITVANFSLDSLVSNVTELLVKGGMLALVIATKANLERHAQPSAQYLLEPDKILDLGEGLKIIHHSEDWRANGRHEAWLVAKR